MKDDSKKIDNSFQNKLKDISINIHKKINDSDSEEDSPNTKNKEIINLKVIFHQKSTFELNKEDINIFQPYIPKYKLNNSINTSGN